MATFYIVTPVRNGAHFLNTAITHIISQAGDFDIHYHIQDGGSSDGTVELIQRWEKMLADGCPLVQCNKVHFSWASEPDAGIYDAINKGFAKLDVPDEGIMGWCNADDMYMPMVFGSLSKIMRDVPTLTYIAGEWRFWENNTLFDYVALKGPYPQEVMQNFCCDCFMWTPPPQPSIFWKGALWRQAGPLDASLHYAGDYEYWRRLALHAECVYWPLSISICTRHAAQLAKQRPTPQSPTFYELEKERIFPMEKRKAFMRSFWNRHILPPKGSIIARVGNMYVVNKIPCWPSIWSKHSLFGYFLRRIRYYKYLLLTLFKKNQNQ